MATFLELQTEVRTAIIDLPTAVSNLVPTFVKRAVRSLQTDYNFRVMRALGSFVSTEGVRILGARPADWKEARGRPYRLGFNGSTSRVNWASSRAEVFASIAAQAVGIPRFILEAEETEAGVSNFELYPLADGNSDFGDGEYRIYVPYWKYLADLAADGSTNWFTVNAEEFIIHTASGYGFQYDWDENRMAVWRQTGEAFRRQVIKRDKLAVLSEVETLVPHWAGANEPKIME